MQTIWPKGFATEAIAHFRHTLDTGESYQAPTLIEDRADLPERQAFDWQIDRITMPDGRYGVICHFFDLTEREAFTRERVKAEAALQARTENLEVEIGRRTAALNAANAQLVDEIQIRERAQAALLESQKLEAVGQLTAGVAHDFNNILASVLSGITLASKRTDNVQVRELLEMSANAAQRGASLVRQLMAFARQQPLAPVTIDVAEAFREAHGLIDIALSSDIAFEISCDENCWQVSADPALLQSALLNLAINSRDAMPDGGKLSVRASNSARSPDKLGDYVDIVVTDNGAGMPPEVLSRIAEPFFTTKSVGQGTGLGVAMVHGFALQSGGALTFESAVGLGTTVTLTLPRAETGASQDHSDGNREQAQVERATILVVDDDPELPGLTSTILSDAGHNVMAAASGEAALALLATKRFDLVLTDVMMPGMDGVELAARIVQLPQPPEVIFMTGRANRTRLEGRVVIDKPFSSDALVQAVARSIKGQLAKTDHYQSPTLDSSMLQQ